jgi:hypothetical protein
MRLLTGLLARPIPSAGKPANGAALTVSGKLAEIAQYDAEGVLREFQTSTLGLTQVESRLERHGLNEVAHEKRLSIFGCLWEICNNLLVVLLSLPATVFIRA